ncbi:MAG: hypothetical protein NTZ87_02315 [Candidatus Nomurabacteria bacterium]|nr:hypothetical protein [Candidatus Nomurabacteria bacterium]
MNNEKILEQINQLRKKTSERKITWKFVNPILVRWVREDSGKNFTVTLQTMQMATIVRPGQPTTSVNKNYVLTIQSTNPSEVLLQVNTALYPLLKEPLEQLFNEAMAVSKDTSAEVIDKLLKNL